MATRMGDGGLTSLPRGSKLGSSPTGKESSTLDERGSPTVRESSSTEPGAGAPGFADQDAQNFEVRAIETLLLRQLRPSPRVGWGIVLGEERLATSMIDISDGLSSDLARLCEES